MERFVSIEKTQIAKSFVFNTLRSNSFLLVNKTLIQALGFVEAGILCNYIDKFHFFETNNPENDGWFYLTHAQQMDDLNVGDFTIRKVKAFLIEQNIIKTKKKGLPAREWMYINFDKLMTLLQSKVPTNKFVDFNELDPPKSTNIYNNKYNNNKYINSLSAREENSPIKEKNIIPPKLEWVSQYCTERKNKVNPEAFHDFYTSKGWVVGKSKMKDWQAAIRHWEKSESTWTGNSPKNKTIKAGSHFSGTKVKYKKSDIIIS
jgi:hypothetical protein